MSDKKTATDTAPKYEPHPKGQYAARCADVIDLGLHPEAFQKEPAVLKDKTALVFRTEAVRDDKPCHISVELTTSMGKKSNMRKLLEAWRGEPYTDEDAKAGIPLDKLEGVPCLITVAHKVSGGGNTYGYISSIAPLPRKMLADAPALDGYERGEFWAKKKAEYAAATLTFTGNTPRAAATDEPPPPEYPEESDDDDSLPF